jgi:hypothetical protein
MVSFHVTKGLTYLGAAVASWEAEELHCDNQLGNISEKNAR